MKRFWGRWQVASLGTFLLLAIFVIGARAWHRHQFPYGWSHCCDIQLMMALRQYAEEHGSRLPAGEETPEASLSLLYPKYADANLLRGKTVPLEKVEQTLAGDGKLGPDTCGWHYVEGLTLEDDGRIAVFWDKAGLGHNGQRHDGTRTVYFLSMSRDLVADDDWKKFLKEQKELLNARNVNEP